MKTKQTADEILANLARRKAEAREANKSRHFKTRSQVQIERWARDLYIKACKVNDPEGRRSSDYVR